MSRTPFDHGCAGYRRMERRQVLTAGLLGGLGLSLPELLRLEAAQAAPKREMSCILLWLRGGPSSIDMWDLKPNAPADIRGEFKPIPTNVPGIEISEHLPLLAKMADKYCLVRSVTHPRDDHEGGAQYNATGWNTWPQLPSPMLGTTVQKLCGYKTSLPPHIHLPEPPMKEAGGAHWLPPQDLPFVIPCVNDPDMRVQDLTLAGGLSGERFSRRRELLSQSGTHAAPIAAGGASARAADAFYQRAFDMLTAPAARGAFDLTREPATLRDRYGRPKLAAEVVAQGNAGDIAPNDYNRSVVGQALLMARRLVQNGVRFVTVIGRGWDTHADNFNRLKTLQLPYVDRAVSSLLQDLHDRGMLDTTLVVVNGDFNRTPKINKDGGRDHWGHVQTVFLAGGGIPGGTVIGASDDQCAYPKDRPISPSDIGATILHRFGIRPETEIYNAEGRPFRVLPDGAQPVPELV